MSLQDKIENDLTQALKNRDDFTRDTLRYLKSSLKNAAINKMKELDESEIITVIQKEVKQRKDAIEQFKTANRPELAEKEQKEADLFEKYLPTQLSDDEIHVLVEEAIKATGATEKKDMGKIMAYIMPKIQGKADGSRISTIVMEKLS